MKKIAAILFSIAALVCCKPVGNEPSGEFSIAEEAMTISSEATEIAIKFTSPEAWSAKSNASWATVKVKEGEGSSSEQTLKVVVKENSGDDARKATIMITTDNYSGMVRLTQTPSTPTKISLLYWNIQNGMWADQEAEYKNFLSWVKSYKPDLCVWNEAATLYKTNTYTAMTWRTGKFPDHWDEFAKEYGHGYTGCSYITPGKNVGYDHYPQVITTNFSPVTKVADYCGLTGSKKDTVITRRGAWQTIEVAGRTINIVTLHTWPFQYNPNDQSVYTSASPDNTYKTGGDYRRAELEYMLKRSYLTHPDRENEYWIVLGDFNSQSRVDQYHYNYSGNNLNRYIPHDYLQSIGLCDVIDKFHNDGKPDSEKKFFTSTGGSSRIDFVYVSPKLMKYVTDAFVPIDNFATQNITTVSFSNGSLCKPSDHRPIYVEFQIR